MIIIQWLQWEWQYYINTDNDRCYNKNDCGMKVWYHDSDNDRYYNGNDYNNNDHMLLDNANAYYHHENAIQSQWLQ